MKRHMYSTQKMQPGSRGWRAWLASTWAVRSAVLVVGVGLVLGLTFLVSPALAAKFSDVYSDTYDNPDYPDAVNALSDIGAISGFNDGTFKPHDPVTRQQFAKMIVKLLGIQVTGDEICPFVDVLSGTSAADPFYPDKYVAECASLGIAKGIDASHFAPYNNITRAQVISMVVRAAKQADITLQDPNEAYYSGRITNSTFRTLSDPIHGLNVQIAEMNNLIWGIWPDKGSSWDVYGKASRGEVAQILWRLWQKMGAVQTTTTTTGGGTTTTTQQPTTTTTQRPTTTTTAPGGATLLFSDDFSDATTGLPVGATDLGDAQASYQGGAYVLECPAQDGGAQVYPSLNVADGRVLADLTLVKGEEFAMCGLVFRAQGENYYDFTLAGAGWYSLWRHDSGGFHAVVNWTQSYNVHTTGYTNHVEVVMSGAHFTIYVNGMLACTATDTTLASGSVGFSVDSDIYAAKASFDKLRVWSE